MKGGSHRTQRGMAKGEAEGSALEHPGLSQSPPTDELHAAGTSASHREHWPWPKHVVPRVGL